jgi:hypothetical protein
MMPFAHLTAVDRRLLRHVIEQASLEAGSAKIKIPVTVMADRLACAWYGGVRDPDRLKSAALSAEIISLLAYRRYFADPGSFPAGVKS